MNGADASIYSLIRQNQSGAGPLESYGQAMQLRELIGRGELDALKLQQAKKAIADADAEESVYREAEGDQSKVLQLLRSRGLVNQAIGFEKRIADRDKSSADAAKVKAETVKMQLNNLRNMTATVQDDAGLAALRDTAFQWFGPQAAQGIPRSISDPAFPQWQAKQIMDADKLLERLSPKLEFRDTGGAQVGMNPYTGAQVSSMTKTPTPGDLLTDERTRAEGAANRGVTLRGQNLTDARAREAANRGRWTNDLDRGIQINMDTGATRPIVSGGASLAPKEKPLTDVQGAATAFGMRASESHRILSELENEGVTDTGVIRSSISGTLGLTPFMGDKLESGVSAAMNPLPGFLGGPSGKQQQTEQARRDFVNAVLRKESGAVISPNEFDNASKQYFPQPGDTKVVIEQKRKNREMAIRALGIQAGPGAKNVTVNTPQKKPKKDNTPSIDPKKLSNEEVLRELGL